ncbi:LAQU0S07e04126g1_1 [Lachancea quebecensis]|uniref:LAQU0S07e04126g1_1 n=1 Tax=Lachancea quebecensis TaxID=1654605 RepID=A0A0P1KS09_9SACH|nr:LAQU0S07e04126g1_1 [Lachancea quebecensis]
MSKEFYTPPNIFRQPAIHSKKDGARSKGPVLNTHKKSWQNDTSRMKSPLLRKASGDMNDFYTTKQLHSEFWSLSQLSGPATFSTSLSSCDDVVLTSNMGTRDNLRMFKLGTIDVDCKESVQVQLTELQSISIPDKSVTASCLLPRSFKNPKQGPDHDRLLLAGQQDGVVNLISTSESHGDAKIINRFNHGKYLRSTQGDSLDSWLRTKRSTPIKHMIAWDSKGFASIINESLFIYDMNQHRLPLYLQSFDGLEAMDSNPYNNQLLALAGSSFGTSGLSLLDLRGGCGYGNLYSPDPESLGQTAVSTNCVWLDEFTVANTIANSVKLWDIRTSGTKCVINGHKGFVEALKYDNENQRLFSSDDQGYTIAWDLKDLKNVSECHLATGLQSIGEKDVAEVKQCGNVIVAPNSLRNSMTALSDDILGSGISSFTFLDTLSNGSLLTLDSKEIGLHSIYDVERPFIPPRNPRRLLSKTELENPETDATLHEDLANSTWEDTSDATVEGDEFTTPRKGQLSPVLIHEKLHKTQNPSIYSLKDLELSGSTIYNERIVHDGLIV